MLGELKRKKTILKKKDYKPIPDALKKKKKLKGINGEAEVF